MSEKIDLFDDDDKANEAMYQMRMQEAEKQRKSLEGQAMEPLLQKAREERRQNKIANKYGEKRGSLEINEFNHEIYDEPSKILGEVKKIKKNREEQMEQDERLKDKLGDEEFNKLPEMTEEDLHLEKQENKLSENISPQTAEENKKRLQQTDKDFLDNF